MLQKTLRPPRRLSTSKNEFEANFLVEFWENPNHVQLGNLSTFKAYMLSILAEFIEIVTVPV